MARTPLSETEAEPELTDSDRLRVVLEMSRLSGHPEYALFSRHELAELATRRVLAGDDDGPRARVARPVGHKVSREKINRAFGSGKWSPPRSAK
jgi:hypothetical protein